MQNLQIQELFSKFQDHITEEQDKREEIRDIVKMIDTSTKQAATILQSIHSDITKIPESCVLARKHFSDCKEHYAKLGTIVPHQQYYRYNEWHYPTQRVVFMIALTVYLENGSLVTREVVAETLGLKTVQQDGFHLDIEDYLMGLLQLASELSRFAINSVTLGDYERPLNISRFVGDLSSGFRLLNLKNDGLRKRFDALKYDVKKIEEVVYDIKIRGLIPAAVAAE
ncbi:hypothetical protein HA402_003125 [Bradysia odoriphaga]|nr:hypothetical protein HA402_003125 [Bradysia odoriphaga]